jgi:pimeloyl-ACP methyl ester carboxylesterase/DNA-binding CsgD family transcriptional regulator
VEQTIRFLKTADGVRLAYAVSGSGPPLVKAANWLSHLEFDWHSPVWRHWFGYLSRGRQLVRYDSRGCGLSDWNVADLALTQQVADLEAVVDAAGLQRFPLLGISQGGAICIEYAARHPERVSHLVLYGAFARGNARRDEESARQAAALVELVRLGWAQENPAFRKLFASLFIPDANEEQVRWFSDLMRTTTRPEIAGRILEAIAQFDVHDRLAQVRCPALVVHARGDGRVPFEEGRDLATGIAGAKFVVLESRNHILIESEPAWARFRQVVDEFLGADGASAGDSSATPEGLEDLTRREADILRLVAQGLSNNNIAARLFISEKTVRNHLTSIFDKLGVDSRARAIVFARNHGLGG